MKKLLIGLVCMVSLCASAQNYLADTFYIDSVATDDVYSVTTIGPYEGKIVAAAFLSLSNMCVGMYASNQVYGTIRPIVFDTTNIASSAGSYTNLGATIFLFRDFLMIRGKLNIDVSGASGYLRGHVIIQE